MSRTVETLLYQDASKRVTVLDLPRSIQRGQCFSAFLASTPAVVLPYPSTEPKEDKREELLSKLPKADRHRDQEICALLSSALLDARHRIGDGDWCFPRNEQCVPNNAPEYPGEHFPAAAQPPLLLSSEFENSVRALTDLQHSLVVNPHAASSRVCAEGHAFLVPRQSTFLWTSIAHGLRLFEELQAKQSTSARFDLVLLDPPWQNRSVRHARDKTYRTAETQDDPFDAVLPLLKRCVGPGGIIAIWITNKAAVRAHVLRALADLDGFRLIEEWIWLKVTSKGKPVTELPGVWRKPYESLLLFSKNRPAASVHDRRIIIAVPDLHSRKPCLKQLLEPLLPHPYQALEVFARNLTAGWWSWGDECLKYQHTTQWDA